MTLSMFHALWTGLMLAIFIGIVVWAYNGKRRQRFDAAARSPLDDDEMDSRLLPLSPRGRRDGEVADVRWTSAPSSGCAEDRAPRREQGERGPRATSLTRGED